MEIEKQANNYPQHISEFAKLDSLMSNYESKLESMLKKVSATPEQDILDTKKKTRTGKFFVSKESTFSDRFG